MTALNSPPPSPSLCCPLISAYSYHVPMDYMLSASFTWLHTQMIKTTNTSTLFLYTFFIHLHAAPYLNLPQALPHSSQQLYLLLYLQYTGQDVNLINNYKQRSLYTPYTQPKCPMAQLTHAREVLGLNSNQSRNGWATSVYPCNCLSLGCVSPPCVCV